MFGSLVVFVAAFIEKILGVMFGLMANYKTEVSFALAVGLSLMLASGLFDRCLIVVAVFFAFFEGYKIGEHFPV